ncbi:MAG: MFS transporter [Desulfarculaceae bacterium]|nr:MFS transporter [Desulfarculaceae bacterium]MCF8073745.1 MFS transporter [Desulfarculaceae bacterium]MCF8101986.1 MFS transporter [Desulfarculaceae bacterium]MCF8115956.1 MFS transporter [Desulfarculaceae bacterium]
MPRSAIHWAWVILAVCFVNLFINFSARLGFGVVLPSMLEPLDISRTGGGTIYNAYLFVYLIFTPVVGYLNDRFGGRIVVTLCALVLGLGLMGMGWATGLGWASAAFGLAGLGATGMWAPLMALTQRWFAPQRRGLALGIFSTGYGLGLACMGALFPLVVAVLNWRWAWWMLGGAALFMVLANGLLLKSSPEKAGMRPWGETGEQAAQPSTASVWEAGLLKQVLGQRLFWIIGLSYFCIVYAIYGVTTFMVDYAQHSLGVPLASASHLATIHGLSQMAGVMVVLPLSDKLGRRNTILISNSCLALAILGILLWGGSWPALCVLVGLLAFFFGANFPIYGACSGDYFPRQIMATVIGAWTVFNGLGSICVHWVAGMLRDYTGGYGISFGIDVGMALAALALMLLVPNRRAA